MKLNIVQKLLCSMLLVTLGVIGIFGVWTRLNIASGFTSYIAKAELVRLTPFAMYLEQAYNHHGNWDFMGGNPVKGWHAVLEFERQLGPRRLGEPSNGAVLYFATEQHRTHHLLPGESLSATSSPSESKDADAGKNEPEGQLAPHRLDLFRRAALYDRQGKLIWGNPDAGKTDRDVELHSGANLIGKLRVAPRQRLSTELEAEFVTGQNQQLLYISIVCFAFTAGMALLLSKHFNTAIEVLVQGTRKLASGQFNTYIDLPRSDELGQLARDFNSLAQALAQYDRTHKQWLTDTSHELRTPVAVLRAQVEALQDGVQQTNEKTLAVLHSEIMALSKLIDDLHDLAKSDIGELRYNFVCVDIMAVMQEALDTYQERFRNKNIVVNLAIPETVKYIVNGDSTRLRQVFLNLFENSARYTNDQGLLQINATIEGGNLLLTFDDSEPGLAADLVPRVFDRFFRGEYSRSRALGGTGLGLAICKSVIEAHGGSIAAASSPLGGLGIQILLPLTEGKFDA